MPVFTLSIVQWAGLEFWCADSGPQAVWLTPLVFRLIGAQAVDTVHPFIHYITTLLLIQLRVVGAGLEPIPAAIGQEGVVHHGQSPICCRANTEKCSVYFT